MLQIALVNVSNGPLGPELCFFCDYLLLEIVHVALYLRGMSLLLLLVLLVVGCCWSLVVVGCCWLLVVVGCWLLVVGCWLLVVGCLSDLSYL